MGSGYFELDFPLDLEEFFGEFLVVWAPKWGLGVSHGQDRTLPCPYPLGMGSGYFEPDFPLDLEEFFGQFLVVGPKMGFGSFSWTRFGLWERMAHSKRFQNSF